MSRTSGRGVVWLMELWAACRSGKYLGWTGV
jgi:hypothetical protein